MGCDVLGGKKKRSVAGMDRENRTEEQTKQMQNNNIKKKATQTYKKAGRNKQ